MPTLYFSKEHEQLVKYLTTVPPKPGWDHIFPRYRDLMLFAAMVGKRNSQVGNRKGNGGEVESNYIAGSFNKEGIVYLLGILETSDPNVLRDGAIDCWKIFEGYCAGGMDIIAGWLSVIEDPANYVLELENQISLEARHQKRAPTIIVKPKKTLTV